MDRSGARERKHAQEMNGGIRRFVVLEFQVRVPASTQ
jgi:hypothetical protein